MKLLVFTAAFYDRDLGEATQMLRRSAVRNNIELEMYGMGETFYFFESKIEKMGVFLNNHKLDFTHALYTDASDSVFLAELPEIIEKYRLMNVPLVVSGEKGIHPFVDLDVLFTDSGPWRFMNPGNFIGEIPYLLDCLSKLKAYKQLQTDDQGHWMLAYRNNDFRPKVDSQCQIFQTMNQTESTEVEFKNGRLFNKVTQTKPCIVHFNGPKGGSPNGRNRDIFYEQLEAYYHEAIPEP